jgi:hypothetical protein
MEYMRDQKGKQMRDYLDCKNSPSLCSHQQLPKHGSICPCPAQKQQQRQQQQQQQQQMGYQTTGQLCDPPISEANNGKQHNNNQTMKPQTWAMSSRTGEKMCSSFPKSTRKTM